jgi:hypothetical protein
MFCPTSRAKTLRKFNNLDYYTDWFEQPLRQAAIKELSGEPMKDIGPRKVKE